MPSPMNIADQFMALDEKIRSGSLRTYGCWFGRPVDNYHVSKSVSFDGEVLKINFEDGEMLEVSNPSGLVVDGIILKIPKASKVKWCWYFYGKPKSAETLMYYEYWNENGVVMSRTNSPWPNSPMSNESAVELC